MKSAKVKLKKVSLFAVLGLVLTWGVLYCAWHFLQLQDDLMLFVILFSVAIPIVDVALSFFNAKFLEVQHRRVELKFPVEPVRASVDTQTYLEFSMRIRRYLWYPSFRVILSVQNLFYPNVDTHAYDFAAGMFVNRIEQKIKLENLRCGYLQAMLKCVEVKDWIGLVEWTVPQQDQLTELAVLPELHLMDFAIEESAGGNNEEIEPQEDKGYVSSEIKEIREYIPGDRLQAIHWKLSAKAGKLMVKEYESMAADHFQILPEPEYNDSSFMDHLFEFIYAFGLQMINERGIGFSVYYYSFAEQKMESVAVHEEADLIYAFTQMYRQPPEGAAGMALDAFRTYRPAGSGFLVYMTRADNEPAGEELADYMNVKAYKVLV